MRRIGYARVSAPHQTLDRQIAALRTQHCDRIFREKASGKDVKNRPQLEIAIDALGTGWRVVPNPEALSSKMANSLSQSNRLHKTHGPVQLAKVREVDAVRRQVGRSCGNKKPLKVSPVPAKSVPANF